jgi:hypothetical protein
MLADAGAPEDHSGGKGGDGHPGEAWFSVSSSFGTILKVEQGHSGPHESTEQRPPGSSSSKLLSPSCHL